MSYIPQRVPVSTLASLYQCYSGQQLRQGHDVDVLHCASRKLLCGTIIPTEEDNFVESLVSSFLFPAT